MDSSDHILPAVNRIDALFKETELEDYYLSVQIGEKSFSYCILDSKTNKYIGIGELRMPVTKGPGEQEIRLPFDAFFSRVMEALPILRKRFKSCKVIWEGRKSTLVPEPLFEEREQQKILAFNVQLESQEKIFNDRMAELHIVNVYAVPEKVNSLLTRTFAVDQLPHLISVLISSIYRNYKRQLIRPKIFMNIREFYFDLVVMDQFKLYYANMFDFHTAEDLIYFTIFVMEQLGFSQEQAEIVLMGKITRNTPLFNLLFKYIRKIDFARRSTDHEYGSVFHEIPPHAYFPLLNLNQCGL
ncbi:MAG: DUF3822 family protein [Bacteroidetes bacterium]|nr:MAG: DUF3822 family protein [Bacteroidota bacterium]